MDNEAVEFVARAICEALGYDPNRYIHCQPMPDACNAVVIHRQWESYIPAARAAILALPVYRAEWRDIATAPMDGTHAIVCGAWATKEDGIHESPTIDIAFYSGPNSQFPGFEWQTITDEAFACWMRPTLWLPIPPPPDECEVPTDG